jgi:acyl-CoA dehydrogenase
MDFSHTGKVKALQKRVSAFMEEHVYPAEARFEAEMDAARKAGNPWQPALVVEELKAKARTADLWNLFLPESKYGAGLTNLEYAPLCEIMGRSHIGAEPFNCSAPDTGTWKRWCATPHRRSGSSGCSRCSTARSVRGLR